MPSVWRRARASNSRAERGGARRLLGRALALLLLAAAPAVAQPRPADPPAQPFLRVEAAAHTAPVARLSTDAAGRILATVSDDKTLRLWDLPEGLPRAVLRPPIAHAEEGELYAVALSPDGARAFAAGHTGYAWDGAFAIYVFDTATGAVLARLPGLPAPVQHLAVSADGALLAAALGGRAGIRVWDARSGRLLWEDQAYAGPARMVAFAGDRLAATGADGRVRVHEARQGRKLAERAPVQGARPFGVAFSPDGSLIAVGFEDRLRVEVLAAADLRLVFAPETAGLAGEGLPAVAWAADGRGGVQLHAAGYARPATAAPARPAPQAGSGQGRGIVALPAGAGPRDPDGRDFVIRRWADFGLGPATDIPAARDAIAHLLPLPGGGLAFAAADPGWGRLAPDGALAIAPRPPGADFRNTGQTLAVSADGTRTSIALRPGGAPLVFDALAGQLAPRGNEAGFAGARLAGAKLALAPDWRNSTRPRLGQTQLRLGEGEFARSATFLPGDGALLLGTDNQLRLYDANAVPQASLAIPGAAWGLAAAGDVAVAALGDGTLRWYRIGPQSIEETAALFIQAETLRWVLFTPEGFFDHAPNGGQELVGLHLNRARNQSPDWASFRQAYRALYAPAAVRARLAGDSRPAQERLAALGEVRQRIGRLPALAGVAICAVTDLGCEPLAFDSRALPEGASALRLALGATDRGLGLGALDVLVNDRLAARLEAPPGGESSIEVPLDPGPNRIQTRLHTEDRTAFAEGPALDLRRPGAPEAPEGSGRLVVLAIGVNAYANPALNLAFAVPDAETVAETFRAQGQGLFREVRTRVLRDAEASRAGVLAALEQAARETEPGDTFVLYIAGHGVRTEPDNRFLFLPHDVSDGTSWQALRRQGIEDSTLVAAIARIRARDAFLLLDTCHAGQLTMDQLSALGNETGRFLLAASTSVQEALDSYDDRNGVFAFALREGLTGRAAVDGDGRVSALALGEWVMRRVPQLAAEKRHRQDAVFRTAQRDLRSFPLAQVRR
jgi:hypothetical protein